MHSWSLGKYCTIALLHHSLVTFALSLGVHKNAIYSSWYVHEICGSCYLYPVLITHFFFLVRHGPFPRL